MGLGETITVVNKSGKVVSTSKHLVNIFKEAKSAYRERKAEIKSTRDADFERKRARKGIETRIENLRIEDDRSSRASSRQSRASSSSSKRRSHRERPPVERGYSDSFYTNDTPLFPHNHRSSGLRHEFDSEGRMVDENFQRNELVRRHTEGFDRRMVIRPKTARSASLSDIDMDLAYGELPPPLPARPRDEEAELRGQMTRLQQLLDECNAVQHSVIATIENLQKNPDALAAVALTLAEVSNLASKMSPGALMAMKGAFPAAVALLLSPEFMIAAGVGVGVTVIALGGYKIIKKIKQRKEKKDVQELESSSEYDELQEVRSDLDRIEAWRRGIADVGADSVGTSVDGEFITPAATRYLVEEGVIREDDLKSRKSEKSSKSKSRSKAKSEKSEKKSKEKADKKERKKKEPSGLKMLFKSHA